MGSGASSEQEAKNTYKKIVYTGAATPRDDSSGPISVTVQILAGETTKISVGRNASIDEIKKMVPEGRVCCLIFKGKVLQGSSTLQKEGIQDGDLLTAALGNVQKLQAIKKTSAWASDSFALLRCDGTVSTWGEPQEGGNSSSAQDRLQNVVDVVGSQSAFTALRSDGEIVTWGHKDFGSALGGHKDALKNVTEIVASGYLVLTSFVVMAGLAYLLSYCFGFKENILLRQAGCRTKCAESFVVLSVRVRLLLKRMLCKKPFKGLMSVGWSCFEVVLLVQQRRRDEDKSHF
eukprot:s3721_g10.t1